MMNEQVPSKEQAPGPKQPSRLHGEGCICGDYERYECPVKHRKPAASQTSKERISEEQLRNTRAWAEARPDMSGSAVIIGAIDEVLEWRGSCTGKHGSQSPCVRSSPEPRTVLGLESLSFQPRGTKMGLIAFFDTPEHAQVARDNFTQWATTPQPVPALPDAILNVVELLHTQDNRITANPLFAVEVKKRVYGIDPEWGGPLVWLRDGEEVTDPDEIKQLEQGWENGDDDPDNHTRTSYHEHWEFVTACFTEEGCKAYLRSNGHNHRGEKRIYAHSRFRNREWEELRRYLMSLRPVPTKCEGTK